MPKYPEELLADLDQKYLKVLSEFQALFLESVKQSENIQNEGEKIFLCHGAGRRISSMRHSTERVFEIFPPNRSDKLTRFELNELQVNIQSFFINVYGVFDNWAWAFIYRHNLLDKIRHKSKISLFKKEMQRFLPLTIRDHLTSETMKAWHHDYHKGYRDGIAHQIPIYIPPFEISNDETEEYQKLESEKIPSMLSHDFERLNEIDEAQDKLGRPCAHLVNHISSQHGMPPVWLHPQMICDGLAVIEFGNLYYENWRNHV